MRWVATGEYGFVLRDFVDLLGAGAVDCLQANVTRCGGITGLLQIPCALPPSSARAPPCQARRGGGRARAPCLPGGGWLLRKALR